MKLTIKAILSRFSGNRNQAIAYCYAIMDTYPQLKAEYATVVDALLS